MSQNETLDLTTDEGAAVAGFRWEEESVSRVYGDNQSDKRTVNERAQIAVMTDVDKWRAHFGDAYIISMSDGTSLRVACQRVGRKFTGKDVNGNRRAVVDHINGIRMKPVAAPRRPMPDGTFYHGTDENEYRSLYAVALTDAGVDTALALTLAKRLPW